MQNIVLYQTRLRVPRRLRQITNYLDRMDRVVAQTKQALPVEATIEEIAREALSRLGLDPPPVMPLTIATVRAHLA